MINPSQRIQGIEQYYFAKKLSEIRAYNAANDKQVINLGIGSPDMPVDKEVIDRLYHEAKKPKASQYQSYSGLPELKASFSSWYSNHFDVVLDPSNEILPLIGSKEGIMHLSMAFLEQGDEVLVPNPGYPAYATCGKIAGATVRLYNLDEDNGWRPNLSCLEEQDLSNVKMMWVNYPNMPTGATVDIEFFKELVSFGKKNEILICHDNPYTFILNDNPISILQVEGALPWALELTSMSKNYNMAGWRLGALAAHKDIIENVLKFKSNMDSGMFKPLQLAASTALSLDKGWFQSLNQKYLERKQMARKILDALNCVESGSNAGLFIWGRISENVSGEYFSDMILDHSKVFITPGFIFGDQGDQYVRLSLCAPLDQLTEALWRIESSKIDFS